MAILLINEDNLETGLDLAYKSFNQSANTFLERHGLNSEGPASKLILKFSIAVWCAVIGALFTFPGLRVARMHWDSIKACSDSKFLGLFLNLNFAAPFFLTLLWLRPVAKHYLTVRVFNNMQVPIMTENAFDALRIVLIVAVVLLRVALMPFYLQAYLNIAKRRIEEQKREAGRITNKELQKKIAAVFYYMCVVALQYVAPILLCLYFALMYKTLGEYSWSNLFDTQGIVSDDEECPAGSKPLIPLGEDDSVLRSAQEITLAIGSLKQVSTWFPEPPI
ncbi:transmembrane protein 161B [Nesidiocoris tenuis]|uniref:Transmembrane protein 161B n=1 Tax=Nesidiocoris tenuis TaxID=355587 RepID=A0ABN7AVK8_9HEMI|nr:transmembrane protein 161B [Nesidiocoris tenuis]